MGDRGQALVLAVLLTTALFGVAALVIDGGSWFAAQRQLQRTADAATLAGAQDLPNTSVAATSANTYANLNSSGLNTWSPNFSADSSTITVNLSKQAPGIFAKALGITSVTVHAHASAQVGTPGQIMNAIPIAVRTSAACASSSTGCFNVMRTLTFDDSSTTAFGSNTAFGLLNLDGSSTNPATCSGTVGQSTQAGWMTGGYPGVLSVNRSYGATSGQRTAIQQALNASLGKPLLFPVFDTADASWCNAGGFHVIAWAAFIVDQAIPNSEWNPSFKQLHGHFIESIVHDVDSVPGLTGFGVKVVKLTQ